MNGTGRRLLVVGAMVITLLGTVTAWVQSNASMALNVSKGSNLDAGTVAEIAPLPVSFTIVQGVAQKVTRIPIYRIKLGNPQLIPNIRISVLNLADVGRVLNNPNAFVDVELWYPDKDASSNYLEIDDAKTPDNPQGKVIQDTGTEARLSRVSGDAALVPTVYNKQTLYVVVSITVPGGIPPGQQEQLSELKFFCDVRM